MPCFSLAVISAFGRRHEAGICLSMPMVGPPFIATTASHVTYRLSSTTPLKLEPNPALQFMHRAPKAGSRCPRRLGQLTIPLLPQITELRYLVRTLGGAILRLANIFREIVETGVREIA
jgi:hypothetical protein